MPGPSIEVLGLRSLGRKMDRVHRASRRAAVRALNRTAVTARKDASTEIRKDSPLKAGTIKRRLEIERASYHTLGAGVKARFRGMRLDNYKPIAKRRKGGGVTVRVKKGSGRQFIRGAFLVPLRRGNVEGAGGMGVALRRDPYKRRKTTRGREYRVLYSTNVADRLDDVRDPLAPELLRKFKRRYRQDLAHYLKRV